MKSGISPSRTYVAVCNKQNFDGHYFLRFTLPEEIENTPQNAVSYFLHEDISACIDGVVTAEDFADVKPLRPTFSPVAANEG